MITTTSRRIGSSVRDDGNLTDDEVNVEFHTLLRLAANEREGRERVHSAQDFAAAKQESDDLLALALKRGRSRRRD